MRALSSIRLCCIDKKRHGVVLLDAPERPASRIDDVDKAGALDADEEWRTSRNGKHFQVNTETGKITKGNVGQEDGPAIERQKAIQAKIDSIKIDAGRDNVLPNLNEDTLRELGKADKPVLLKANIIKKNLSHHPDVSLDEYAVIVGTSLYKPDVVIPGHSEKPYFNFMTRVRDDKNTVVLLEMSETKDNYEIVNLHWLGDEGRMSFL